MKKYLIGIGATFALVGATHFLVGVSAYNYGNRMDNQIIAQYDANRNVLSNTSLKIKEMFAVRDEHYSGLQKIIETTMSGRYGQDGSKAVFQFMKENNIPIDTSLDKNVQAVIESGRNEFQESQKALISLKASYKTELGSYLYGTYVRNAGYPKIDLNKYDIIIEQSTDDKFISKKDSVIKLR